MMVVDAAVSVDFLLDLAADAQAVRDRLARESLPWAAAELLDAEVAHVIRRRILRGELSSSDAMAALSGLTAMEIDRHSHRALLLARWGLRQRHDLYALHLALAEALEVPLLTRDGALPGVPGVAVPVEVIAPDG